MQNLDLKNIYLWPLPMQAVVFAILFVVVLYFGYLFDISNMRAQLVAATAQENDLKAQVEFSINKEATLSNEIARFPVLTGQLGKWQSKLVKSGQLPELLNEILKIGSDNHIYFNLLEPGDVVKDGKYTKVPIHAKLVGSYQDIGEFISKIANLTWIISVGDFTITVNPSRESNASSGNLLAGEFTFEVYQLSETLG